MQLMKSHHFLNMLSNCMEHHIKFFENGFHNLQNTSHEIHSMKDRIREKQKDMDSEMVNSSPFSKIEESFCFSLISMV